MAILFLSERHPYPLPSIDKYTYPQGAIEQKGKTTLKFFQMQKSNTGVAEVLSAFQEQAAGVVDYPHYPGFVTSCPSGPPNPPVSSPTWPWWAMPLAYYPILVSIFKYLLVSSAPSSCCQCPSLYQSSLWMSCSPVCFPVLVQFRFNKPLLFSLWLPLSPSSYKLWQNDQTLPLPSRYPQEPFSLCFSAWMLSPGLLLMAEPLSDSLLAIPSSTHWARVTSMSPRRMWTPVSLPSHGSHCQSGCYPELTKMMSRTCLTWFLQSP